MPLSRGQRHEIESSAGEPLELDSWPYRKEHQMHTTESVLAAFQRATEFAMRLPCAGPAGISNPWPHILRLGYEGYCEKGEPSSGLTAAEMEEYETTLSWMSYIKEEPFRRILWAFAAGTPGWRIAKTIDPRVSQSTISRRIMWALGFITYKLNHGETPPGFHFQRCEK